ncbi:MAG: acetolactate synthase [Spirochaetales bacterium]|nr:acetolactate synthase [Spirochaetales bacterium]
MATVSEVVIRTIRDSGIKYVFGVPSGAWVNYMKAINDTKGIEFVLVSNEAGGAIMADACWRLTGLPAACFGTYGPGACNVSTGVVCAYLDRSAMLVFTDEMSDSMRDRTTQMNIDHQALFSPITKWTTRLKSDAVRATIQKAVGLALSEVPGPVHVGLPVGMGDMAAASESQTAFQARGPDKPEEKNLKRLAELFGRAAKPIFALGITAVRAKVRDLVLEVAEKFQVPIVLTPMAKGMVSESHPSYAGVLAHALANHVGQIHQTSDLVIGVGYDPAEINYEAWMPDVPLVSIDTVPADIDEGRFTLACDVVGDIAYGLRRLLEINGKPKNWDMGEIAGIRNEMFDRLRMPDTAMLHSSAVLGILRDQLPESGVMTCDVGAHLHLIGQLWETPAPGLLLMTNGGSSMGYAIPSAISAKLCCSDREVACVVGDGGFLMMAGELATATRLKAKVVFILLSDNSLSLIRIKQDRQWQFDYGTELGKHATDIGPVLFGVPVITAATIDEYREALKSAFSHDGPVMVKALVDTMYYDELLLKGNR